MEKPINYQKIADMVIVPFKHVFSDEELLQKAFQLAQLNGDIEHEESEKKATAAEYKNKIDKLKAEAKLISGHVNNKFCMVERPCELFLDYNTNTRVYMDKVSGDEIKHEPFHAGDYQKKIDFTGISSETERQIDENNAVGEFAQGDALDQVINNKKNGKKATAEDFLVGHKFDDEIPDGMRLDRHGDLTDLPGDEDDLFANEEELPE